MRQLFPALLLALLAGPAMAQAPSADYAGQYRLTDGRVLTIRDNDGTLTAQVARPSATQNNAHTLASREFVLTPVGPGRFRATATPLQITFGQDAAGAIAQVSLDEQAPLQTLARR
ncbi:MAG: hypothetical protein M3Y65_12170 [Pseudomonadota bacterium]|nr:hypothetical protein [Pseudomonadota bacterium]